MSWLTKAGIGISKLSEIEIDADKDWQAREIRNLKAIVTGMVEGDIAYRGPDVLEKLAGEYGIGYNFLHMRNTGALTPEWMDIQDIIIYLTGAVNRMIALPTLQIPTPAVGVAVVEDHSGGGLIGEKSLTIPTPSIATPTTATYSPVAVEGTIADDGGTQTDETTAANNATANDMTLLPATPAVNDAYYFGLSSLWDWLSLNIGTAGAGTWTVIWEYWNGSTWASLPDAYDTSNGFRNGGFQSVSFARPSDWATSTILLLNLYWIRARVSAYTSITTQPLGTQVWIGIH